MAEGNSNKEDGGGAATATAAAREEAVRPHTAGGDAPREISRERTEPEEPPPPPPQAAPPDDAADPDGMTSVSVRTGGRAKRRGSGADAERDWEKASRLARRAVAAKTAVGKVKLENKIGRRVSRLHDGDSLKVAALSAQRALRDFGTADASEAGGVDTGSLEVGEPGAGAEGTFPAADIVEYEGEKARSKYTVRQPCFRCCRIRDGEFSRVRSAFGITDRQYYAVFGLQEGRSQSDLYVVSSKDASGKSKSFFFLSPDQRYLLKSCTSKDVKTLVSIARRYREYVESCKEESGGKSTSATLLPRYLGLYSLEFADPDMFSVVMVAMTNFFGGVYEIHRKFDLKGSTYHRMASPKERAKRSPVYKDLDWSEEGRRLRFPTRAEMRDVRGRLMRDTSFLRDCGLIDYSLLVGIHDIDGSTLDEHRHRRPEAMRVISVRSGNDTISYYGIVDVLTPYGLRKRGETLLTGNLMCCRDVSCQPPTVYQRRFMKFCDDEVLACDDDGDDCSKGNEKKSDKGSA